MMVPMADCIGLWRRTLLIEADGSHDTDIGVLWLQGLTAYVDSRGFAGRLAQHGDVFEWERDIDVQPPGPHPDAGSMRWEGDTLVETGVHADYVEHWVRDDGPGSPCWATLLRSDLGDALLLRVGELFGWADAAGAVVGTVGGAEWSAADPGWSDCQLRVNGVRWNVVRSEGNVDL